MKIAIVIDSSSGLNEIQAKKLGWYFLPLGIEIDGNYYRDGVDIDGNNIWSKFKNNSVAQTSSSNLAQAEQLFDELSQKYDKVVVYPISKYLSSQYDHLSNLAQKYENVTVIESLKLAFLIVLSLLEFEEDIKNNMSFDTAVTKLTLWREQDNIFLIPKHNYRLVAGGRLSPQAAALTKLLKIVPIIKFDKGQLLKHSKGVVFSRAVRNTIKGILNKSKVTKPFILHSQCKEIQDYVSEFSNLSLKKITVLPIPPVISIHTGHEAVAIVNVDYNEQAIEKFARMIGDQ